MPDYARYRQSLQSIQELLEVTMGARPLTESELSYYGNRFCDGWELPGQNIGTGKYNLRVLLPPSVPFNSPRVAAWPAPSLLEWPHLEPKGLLCLLSNLSTYSTIDCAGVVRDLLRDAIKLVNDSVAGANSGDFEDEFQSYWIQWDRMGKEFFYVLCRPEGPSRWVSSWRSQTGVYAADDEAALLKWLRNRKSDKDFTSNGLQKIPLLWLPRPLRPDEYPKKVNFLDTGLKNLAVDNTMVKQLLVNESLRHKDVVIGFEGRTGSGFAGLSIAEPTISLKKGFHQRPPDSVVLMRYRGAKISGSCAVRLDASWIHGRDHNPHIQKLLTTTVVIFGVGSLGSFVADLLVMSGVGRLIIVDPEKLASENPARHRLGLNSLHMNKATTLAKRLAARFPHLDISGYDMTCEDFFKKELPSLGGPDLFISTIGAWRSEGWLNAMAVASSISSPILYGWAEPHATAGHAVVFRGGHGCLNCIRDHMGRPKLSITTWPAEGTLKAVPACGGFFQPYGAIEVSHVHSLIADLALDVLLGNITVSTHRIWIGARKIIESSGGRWNPEWVKRHGDPGEGQIFKEISILPDRECPECAQKERQNP